MSDYYYLADIENRKLMSLGKAIEAKGYLTFLASMYAGKPVCLFGDETHAHTEERYVYDLRFEEDDSVLAEYEQTAEELTICEFRSLVKEIGGKEIGNIEEYIPQKQPLEASQEELVQKLCKENHLGTNDAAVTLNLCGYNMEIAKEYLRICFTAVTRHQNTGGKWPLFTEEDYVMLATKRVKETREERGM